jgi:hypothetical protein
MKRAHLIVRTVAHRSLTDAVALLLQELIDLRLDGVSNQSRLRGVEHELCGHNEGGDTCQRSRGIATAAHGTHTQRS